MILRAKVWAAIALAGVLAGCVAVDVPEGAFFWPDARLDHDGIVLEPNPPPPGSETLPLRYAGGAIGATRGGGR